jgi:peptidoglycan/xylan/chitin deacetylase (PgdA/CDA1 family)
MNLLFITYHRTTSEPETDDVHTVTSKQFARHIELILQAGVSVADAHVLEVQQSRTGHQIAITFDDGFKSDIANAELLASYGLTAMFFISTANIGKKGYMDEGDIRRLDGMGMLIGSHSHLHKRLNKLPEAEARTQLELSKQRLESILRHPVEYLAFPGGGYNASVITMATAVGFRYMLTTDWGVNAVTDNLVGRLYKRNNIVQNMTYRDFARLITLKSLRLRKMIFVVKQCLRALLPENGYGALRKRILRSNKNATV